MYYNLKILEILVLHPNLSKHYKHNYAITLDSDTVYDTAVDVKGNLYNMKESLYTISLIPQRQYRIHVISEHCDINHFPHPKIIQQVCGTSSVRS